MINTDNVYPGQFLFVFSNTEIVREEFLRADYGHIHFKNSTRIVRAASFKNVFDSEKEALEYSKVILQDKLLKVEDRIRVMNGSETVVTIGQVCDYIIVFLLEAGIDLSFLKLQKLLYYVQAWHLAFYAKPLFDGKFQAWVLGPINREIYDRFLSTGSLYSKVELDDILDGQEGIPNNVIEHIEGVLETYAKFTDSQLGCMFRGEEPCRVAREGLHPAEQSERVLDETVVVGYYAKRLA